MAATLGNKMLIGAAVLVAGSLLLWLMIPRLSRSVPRIPPVFAMSLPDRCQQVMLVLSPEEKSVAARLWLLERSEFSGWHPVAGPISVTLGHQGLAWGSGGHTAPAPAGFRIKREGDGCSPAGVFRIPFAFGMAPAAEATWLKLSYTPLTSSIVGIEDPDSCYYNQIVDASRVQKDWHGNEVMARRARLYRWGAFVDHNPSCTPGWGSCIFLHLWPAPGKGTAGCTAMAEDDLKHVLAWLDPAREPRLVQALEAW